MGAEDFACLDKNLGLQHRSKLYQNQRFSYIIRIPRSWGYSPTTEGCDSYTKTYDFGRVWTDFGDRYFDQKLQNPLPPSTQPPFALFEEEGNDYGGSGSGSGSGAGCGSGVITATQERCLEEQRLIDEEVGQREAPKAVQQGSANRGRC